MALSTDVMILGSNHRGLWLATELVQLGWSVTWVQVKEPLSDQGAQGFHFDDWAFHVGPQSVFRDLGSTAQDFVTQVFKPTRQEMSIQVLTPKGPLELTGPMKSRVLKHYFPKAQGELTEFLESIHQLSITPDPIIRKRLTGLIQKLFEKPLGDRWVLEWLGQLPLTRDVTAKDWFLNSKNIQLSDPLGEYLLLEDQLKDVTERAIAWAEQKGVKVKRNAELIDIGDEGSRVTGVELKGADGFLSCKYLINTLGFDQLALKTQGFSEKLALKSKKNVDEAYVWAKTGFKLKPFSRPSGALSFFSVVMDPYMPLRGDNLMLMKWKVQEAADNLTVWVKIPFGELFRRGYLSSIHSKIEGHLSKLMPRFQQDLIAAIPFEGYFEIKGFSHADLPVVYKREAFDRPFNTRFKNMWNANSEYDQALYLMSGLVSEKELFKTLSAIRSKELKRDRKIHPSGNGPSLGAGQAV